MTTLPIHTRGVAALGLFCALAGPFLSGPGRAAESAIHDDLPAVRGKVLLHDERHAVSPVFGMTLGDPYVRNVMLGGSWRYYLQGWLGVGADVLGGVGLDTDLADQISSEIGLTTPGFELEATDLRLLANAALELVPLDGKLMVLGDKLLRLDLHAQVGFGMALVSGEGRIDDQVSIMPMFGAGIRVFPEPWIAIGLDLRDYVIKRTLAIRKDGSVPGEAFGHNVLVGVSVAFFLPGVAKVKD